jgi:hypothetical protein
MAKFGNTDIALDGIAYFGIQSPLLKAHNLAHYINKYLEIELVKTFDFESYAVEQSVAFPCYIHVSEIEQCTYYLIGNKSTSALFPNYPEVDFWFLMQAEKGVKEDRFLDVKRKLYNDLCQVEQVFSVLQAEPQKLANFKDFEIDFLEFCTQLLQIPPSK